MKTMMLVLGLSLVSTGALSAGGFHKGCKACAAKTEKRINKQVRKKTKKLSKKLKLSEGQKAKLEAILRKKYEAKQKLYQELYEKLGSVRDKTMGEIEAILEGEQKQNFVAMKDKYKKKRNKK